MNKYANINTYKATDCGRWGKPMESALTGTRCKPQGKVDWYYHGRAIEVKTGGGKLNNILRYKTRAVCYIPVPLLTADGDIDLDHCEGFIFENPQAFIATIKDAGYFVVKSGIPYIQTFWVHKTNKPHSKKGFARLLDALYDSCDCTLDEYLAGD